MLLQDRVYLITGAAGGIGRAAALAIAAQGGKVALSDVNLDGVAETAQLVTDAGGAAWHMRCDVTDAAEVEAYADAAVAHFGGIDGAFNNAGVGGTLTKLHELSEATWDTVIDINLKSVWLCMKYQIPRLREGKGAIVNMASAAGVVALPNNAVYTASKHGVIGLTKAAALEYARRGIRVNAVCPGFTDTAMVSKLDETRPGSVARMVDSNPMRRLGESSETAAAVVWLLSDESSFVNGHALVIDGGLSVS
ncbi:MAG: SDR family oxidoreductase [Armatimonadetes bacterium]|nr:SDR family oxidoreductase [Anaerolineae bacterium]